MPITITQLNPPRLEQTFSTYIGDHYKLVNFEIDFSQLLPTENLMDFVALFDTVDELNFTLSPHPLDQNGNRIPVTSEFQRFMDNLPFNKNTSDSQEDTQ